MTAQQTAAWSNDISMEMIAFPDTGNLLRQPYPMPLPHHSLTPDFSGGLAPTHMYQNHPLIEHEVTANVGESSHSMGPPPRKRAKKTSTTRAEDWIPHKARIFELYMEKNWKLEDVRKTICEETGFNARYVLYPPRGSNYDVVFAIL